MLDQAFDALKKFNWGTPIAVLEPIEDAVVTTHGDAAARAALENRLAAVLTTEVSRDAKDYVCRKLTIIATAASVPTLAPLLAEKDHSHMARYALERIPAPEAAQAMRDALAKLDGSLKIGVIASLGVRRDTLCVPALGELLAAEDAAVAAAAAQALGDIRTPEAAKALADARPKNAEVKRAVVDASLACAEGLLAGGNAATARTIYKSLASGDQPKYIRVAATRGMISCMAKQRQ